jgi:hypothetical protein
MSKFLPFENIEYRTGLSGKEILERLRENIEAQKSFGFLGNNTLYSKSYIGFVGSNCFQMKRAINYRNSFLPEIRGTIFEQDGSTRIKVTMKPVGFILAFMIVWFGGVSVACLAVVYAAFSGAFHPAQIVPFGMLLFGLVLVSVGFKTESRRSIKDLKGLLDAEIV